MINRWDELYKYASQFAEGFTLNKPPLTDFQVEQIFLNGANYAKTVYSEGQWVRCDDRLPDEEGEYDVTAPGLGGELTMYVDEWHNYRGEPQWSRYQGVTAWRERPKPFTGESK